MRNRRGFTLVELMTGMGILAITLLVIVNLLIYGIRSFGKTTTDVNISQQNAQGMRRVMESIRASVSVSISSDGKRIDYALPKIASTTDPVTGEKEVVIPIQSDGVNRYFLVSGGNLIDQTGRVLVRSITATDPEPTSSQYNLTYAPFQSTTIGSRRAVTVTLITKEQVNGSQRWARMKSTVLIRNSQ
jgi:prepilin-type N-terminal cleavage/methylation domain-containing protein